MRRLTKHHVFAWSAPVIIWTNAGVLLTRTIETNFKWYLYRNQYIFIQENAFENVVGEIAVILKRPQCVYIYREVLILCLIRDTKIPCVHMLRILTPLEHPKPSTFSLLKRYHSQEQNWAMIILCGPCLYKRTKTSHPPPPPPNQPRHIKW